MASFRMVLVIIIVAVFLLEASEANYTRIIKTKHNRAYQKGLIKTVTGELQMALDGILKGGETLASTDNPVGQLLGLVGGLGTDVVDNVEKFIEEGNDAIGDTARGVDDELTDIIEGVLLQLADQANITDQAND